MKITCYSAQTIKKDLRVIYSASIQLSPRSVNNSSTSSSPLTSQLMSTIAATITIVFKTHFTMVHGVKQRSLQGLFRQQWHCTKLMQSQMHNPQVRYCILQQNRKLMSKLLKARLNTIKTAMRTNNPFRVIEFSPLIPLSKSDQTTRDIQPMVSTDHIRIAPSSRYLQK